MRIAAVQRVRRHKMERSKRRVGSIKSKGWFKGQDIRTSDLLGSEMSVAQTLQRTALQMCCESKLRRYFVTKLIVFNNVMRGISLHTLRWPIRATDSWSASKPLCLRWVAFMLNFQQDSAFHVDCSTCAQEHAAYASEVSCRPPKYLHCLCQLVLRHGSAHCQWRHYRNLDS